MEKSYVEWKGEKFPVRTLDLPESWDYVNPVNVSDVELWDNIEQDYYNGNKKAVSLDNSIFYYFDCGWLGTDPTDEEIIERLKDEGINN